MLKCVLIVAWRKSIILKISSSRIAAVFFLISGFVELVALDSDYFSLIIHIMVHDGNLLPFPDIRVIRMLRTTNQIIQFSYAYNASAKIFRSND